MTLPYFLVTFCTGEVLLTFPSEGQKLENVELTTCRLRNHFDYLTDEIEKERLFAMETMRIYESYCEKHQDIGWKQVMADPSAYTNFSDRTWKANTRDTFLNNIYAALHYVPGINNYGSLMATIRFAFICFF